MIVLVTILFICLILIFFLYKEQETEIKLVHAFNASLTEYIRENFGNENIPTAEELYEIGKEKGFFD